jgi:hypothetical protein
MLPGPRKRRPSRSAKPPSGVLEVAVGVLVIALAVVIPLMLLLIVAWAAQGAYARRARTAALDAVEKRTTR